MRGLLDARLADLDAQVERLVPLRSTIAELRDDATDLDPELCSTDHVCRYRWRLVSSDSVCRGGGRCERRG